MKTKSTDLDTKFEKKNQKDIKKTTREKNKAKLIEPRA